MEVLKFIKANWTILTFIGSILIGFVVFAGYMIEATKCSLRNDILTIYNNCKKSKKITQFELDAIMHSSEVYFKLHGNSFVKQIVEIVKKFDITE